jgi:hypothetical protein
VATEAAWLNGNNLEKEKTKKEEEERKKRQNERKDLTLTGLLMEEVWSCPKKELDKRRVLPYFALDLDR